MAESKNFLVLLSVSKLEVRGWSTIFNFWCKIFSWFWMVFRWFRSFLTFGWWYLKFVFLPYGFCPLSQLCPICTFEKFGQIGLSLLFSAGDLLSFIFTTALLKQGMTSIKLSKTFVENMTRIILFWNFLETNIEHKFSFFNLCKPFFRKWKKNMMKFVTK